MKDFIILQHQSPVGTAFDLLARKDLIEDLELLEIKEHGYPVNCRYADKFIENNPEYVYVWSEDNGHIPEFNWIEEWVNDKASNERFEILVLDKTFVEEKEGEQ